MLLFSYLIMKKKLLINGKIEIILLSIHQQLITIK